MRGTVDVTQDLGLLASPSSLFGINVLPESRGLHTVYMYMLDYPKTSSFALDRRASVSRASDGFSSRNLKWFK